MPCKQIFTHIDLCNHLGIINPDFFGHRRTQLGEIVPHEACTHTVLVHIHICHFKTLKV